jgi:hypothetical protein
MAKARAVVYFEGQYFSDAQEQVWLKHHKAIDAKALEIDPHAWDEWWGDDDERLRRAASRIREARLSAVKALFPEAA